VVRIRARKGRVSRARKGRVSRARGEILREERERKRK
tara:strand:- start:359 stop:469 length:111 start_codon:yes stop_codon:yes gene_type:complete